MIKINVDGFVKTDECKLPEGIVQALSPRADDGVLNGHGYPKVCRLDEFFPAAKHYLNINQVMITDARLVWHYEDKYADIQIALIAPPQEIEV